MSNNKFKKKLIASSIFFSLLLTSSSSYAVVGVLTSDFGLLTETLAGNIQSLKNWVEEKAMMKMDMNLKSILAQMGIEKQEETAVVQIHKTQEMEQAKSKVEALKDSTPANNACKTLGVQSMGAAVTCDASTSVKNSIAKSSAANANFGASKNEYDESIKKINKEVVETCESLPNPDLVQAMEEQEVNSESDKGKKLRVSKCLLATNLLSSDPQKNTLVGDDLKAAEKFAQLITGVEPTFKKSVYIAEDSVGYQKQAVEESRLEAFRGLVSLSFAEIKAIKEGSGTENDPNPSQLSVLDEFNDQHFGDKTWMASLQNVDAATKNSVQPPEVLRHIAVMDAFMIHLELLKFKQQLRMEALQAALLSHEINAPKP